LNFSFIVGQKKDLEILTEEKLEDTSSRNKKFPKQFSLAISSNVLL